MDVVSNILYVMEKHQQQFLLLVAEMPATSTAKAAGKRQLMEYVRHDISIPMVIRSTILVVTTNHP
jgi:hypothetical protein